MSAFWLGLTLLGKILFVVAFASSVGLVVQIILLLIGFADGDIGDVGGTDIDTDGLLDGSGSGASLFTIKGIIAFFAIGGWVGLGLDIAGIHIALTLIIAMIAGFAALTGIGLLYRLLYKLQSSGNIDSKNAIGKIAEVYLTIPANDNGTGKITLTIQERLVELEARTKSAEPIKTGAVVKVVSKSGDAVYVEPIGAEQPKNE